MKLNEKLLNMLGQKRLKLEKRIVKESKILNQLGLEEDEQRKKVENLRLEKTRLGSDIRLVCSGEEPKFSKGFKKRKIKKRKKVKR